MGTSNIEKAINALKEIKSVLGPEIPIPKCLKDDDSELAWRYRGLACEADIALKIAKDILKEIKTDE